MTKKIDAVCAAIRHQETVLAVGRQKLIRIHNNVSLASLKRMSSLIPLDERRDLSLGFGWGWRRVDDE